MEEIVDLDALLEIRFEVVLYYPSVPDVAVRFRVEIFLVDYALGITLVLDACV